MCVVGMLGDGIRGRKRSFKAADPRICGSCRAKSRTKRNTLLQGGPECPPAQRAVCVPNGIRAGTWRHRAHVVCMRAAHQSWRESIG